MRPRVRLCAGRIDEGLDTIPEEDSVHATERQKKPLRRSLSNIIQKVVKRREQVPELPRILESYTTLDPDLFAFFQRIVVRRYKSLLKQENPHLTADELDKYSLCQLTSIDSRNEYNDLLVDFYDCTWLLRYRHEDVETAITRQKWHDSHPEFRQHALGLPSVHSTESNRPFRPRTSATMFHDAPEDSDDDWMSAKTSIPERDISYIEYTSSILSNSILSDTREPTNTPVSPTPVDPPPVGAFYDVVLLNKLIIQGGLKELTGLGCIPSIHDCGIWLDFSPEIRNRMPSRTPPQKGLSWILEDPGYGVPINVTRSSKGTDKIFMLIDGQSIPLAGKRKERFLDGLAGIQIAFSMIRSQSLGTISLTTFTGDNGLVPAFELDDRFDSMTAEIIPTHASVESYFRAILDTPCIPPFLRYLANIGLTFLTPLSAPYPLCPPSPLWTHVLVDPATGGITHLRDVHLSRTVPWEIAAQPPLRLSRKERSRYLSAFKRHCFGSYQKEPRVDELSRTEDIVECILRMKEVRRGEEERRLEEQMVSLLFGTRDVERRKIKWEKERTMI